MQQVYYYSALVKYFRKKWEYKEAVHQFFIDAKKVHDLFRREVLYKILVRLIQMCLTETYNRGWVGKNLSDLFPIRNCLRQGDALSPLLTNWALEYTITSVQVNQVGLKLHGTHQLIVYADDVNILGGSVHTIKENAQDLVVANKEIGLEVNADRTKYMVMSRDQNAGRSHSMKIDNSYFERMEDFKYLETTLTNQNSIRVEIKSRLKPVIACYHSAQNLLSPSLLPKNLKIKVYRTIILPVVLYGCETSSLTLGEVRMLRVFENSVLEEYIRA